MEGAQAAKRPLLIWSILTFLALPFLIGGLMLLAVVGGLGVGEKKENIHSVQTGQISDEVRYAKYINQAAQKTGLNPALIASVIKQESGFDPNVQSSKGAVGLMQLTEETAKAMGVEDRTDPKQNILGGSKYLKKMMDRYDSLTIALSAYNAGPGAVDKYGGKVPPFPETVEYVQKVSGYYKELKKNVKSGKLADGGGKLGNPVPNAEVSSHFGLRERGHHRGQDFAAPIGTPIYATNDGIVTRVETPATNPRLGPKQSYGTLIEINHGGGLTTRYAHMFPSSIQVHKGQKVKKGDQIGAVGDYGNSTGPHLHFEVLQGGKAVNPAGFLN